MNIPILLYHRIASLEDGGSLCVSPERFHEQMETLAKNGYKVVSLSEAIAHHKGPIELPFKSVAITFDDGYLDNYQYAFPVLKKFGFTATIFLVADRVGQTNTWDEAQGLKSARLMDWPQIHEMAESGITFGSHGWAHRRLHVIGKIPYLFQEVWKSRQMLESRLKKPVTLFSYPYGKFNSWVKLCVKVSGYEAAFATRNRKNSMPLPNRDLFALKRLEVNSKMITVKDFVDQLHAWEKPRLNILQVCTKKSLGGQEVYALQLAVKLKERGHHVVFAVREGSPLEARVKGKEIPIEHLKIISSFDVRSILRLRSIIKKNNIHVVHIHPSRDYFSGILASKLSGCKVVLTRHLLGPLHRLTQRMMRRSDGILAVSRATQEVLIGSGIIPKERVHIQYNGVDVSRLVPDEGVREEARGRFGFRTEDFVIVNIGRMKDKGQIELLHAVKEVREQYPQVKAFFAVPDDGLPELQKWVEELKLTNTVTARGYTDDLSALLNLADLFVILPQVESLSLITLEAMACAKPVIATRVGGIPEIVHDGENGLLVAPENHAAVVEAIIEMIKHPETRQRMGLAGLKRVREEFDLEKAVDRLEQFFDSLY